MGRWPAFELTSADVRHNAGGLLVVSKPAGLAVHATLDRARPHLAGAVQAWLESNGGGRTALHHRLDVDTSGLVLFTTDPSLNAPVSEMFRAHTIEKVYRAVVQPRAEPPPDVWTVENFLGRDKDSKATRYRSVRSGGKKAITKFEVLERRGAAVLVEARPVTGRAHQIRVHCAEAGWPVVGDPFYGDPGASRLLLHARRLRFEHPRGGLVDVQDPGDARFSTAPAID